MSGKWPTEGAERALHRDDNAQQTPRRVATRKKPQLLHEVQGVEHQTDFVDLAPQRAGPRSTEEEKLRHGHGPAGRWNAEVVAGVPPGLGHPEDHPVTVRDNVIDAEMQVREGADHHFRPLLHGFSANHTFVADRRMENDRRTPDEIRQVETTVVPDPEEEVRGHRREHLLVAVVRRLHDGQITCVERDAVDLFGGQHCDAR